MTLSKSYIYTRGVMKHCVSESATLFPGFSPTRRRVGENPGNEVAEGASCMSCPRYFRVVKNDIRTIVARTRLMREMYEL